jgi:hypothetical protein
MWKNDVEHASIQTTERHPGCSQKLEAHAFVAMRDGRRKGEGKAK